MVAREALAGSEFDLDTEDQKTAILTPVEWVWLMWVSMVV